MPSTAQPHPHLAYRRCFKALPAALALISACASMILAVQYPLVPQAMTAAVLMFWVVAFTRPHIWLLLLPALLPVIGLAPWSGWITFEELDILILAVATGGYARMAWPNRADSGTHESSQLRQGPSLWVWVLVGLFSISTISALFRGFVDAGGFTFSWFQGYHEPMNSVRLFKSLFEALLLIPLWRMVNTENPIRSCNLLSRGLMLGLAATGMATLWERAAFTGLLDFSSNYRTTAMFWEMHVGGAALDGFLALTVPFALRELLVARTPVRWGLAAGSMALAGYACLTTFSRGVYLAIPISIVVFLGLQTWHRKHIASAADAQLDTAVVAKRAAVFVLLVAGACVGAFWMFPTSGYRGMAALLVTVMVMLPLARVLRGFNLGQWLLGGLLATGLVLLAVVTAWLLSKGAYVAYGLAAMLTTAMLFFLGQSNKPHMLFGPVALGGFVAMAASTALIAHHWGGASGLFHAAPMLTGVLGVGLIAGICRRPIWPEALRWQGSVAAALGMVAAVLSVLGGGNYMNERFATGRQDFGGRQAHWQLGRDMLHTPADLWFGKGLGRFPADYFLAGNPEEHPGDYRLRHEGENTYVTLGGGLHINGWGEIFRVSQRVAEPGNTAIVTASVRAEKNTNIHFEVCEKHLLYNGNCLLKEIGIKGTPGVWQPIRLQLQGASPVRGDGYAPRLLAFSMAISSLGGIADIDNITLTSADGRDLLTNGDFSREMARWFFSSDRHHLPWHIKSIFMNVLFDQGILGLSLWSALLVGALWRTSLGTARRHPLAPALAASLTGFAVVGLFDSLLDVPRLAWLFYLLLLLALTLRPGLSGQPSNRPRSTQALASLVVAVVACCAVLQSSPVLAQSIDTNQRLIRVGPGKAIKTIAQAAQLASAGAIIEIDSGDYSGDVAVWTQDRLTLRAVGGRVRLIAAGAAAEEKAIWVMRGGQMSVEGFDFTGARVSGQNGAGIRLERGALRVRDCTFTDNENGILTGNEPQTELEIENSEFGHNGYGDGQSHNLYAGAIARLSVKDSHFHHARVGHLLKSRAKVNHMYNNRLVDGDGGSASYELEFPVGGEARVVGNVIAQSTSTQNPHLISFGAEGYKWPRNEIHLENNTLVNPLPKGGVFLRVAPVGVGAIRAVNNRLVGQGTLETAGPGEYRDNTHAALRDGVQALDGATHNSGLPQRSTPRLP